MVNRDLIEIFIELAREKNIERSELGTIIEQLFLFIIDKEKGESDNCSVIVNLDKGEIEIYVEKTIVDNMPESVHYNGGMMIFGPDWKRYVGTCSISESSHGSQDIQSL